jgi:2-oxoisovalerate dehydrogenase E2 component (dihydrolipoyl transacylase)
MTARHFLLPDLCEGLASAEVVAWLVAAGDKVEVDQPVVEVMTAKTNVELPSPFAGVVTALHHTAGDVVEVGQPLVTVEAEVGSAEVGAAEAGAAEAGAAEAGAAEAGAAEAGASVGAAEADHSPSDGSSGNVLVGYGGGRGSRRPQRCSPPRPRP